MSKKTVLIVEDHPGDRNMYGNILWYNGYDVVFAEDGQAGGDGNRGSFAGRAR